MDIVERLLSPINEKEDYFISQWPNEEQHTLDAVRFQAAKEIKQLREALKTFADNVRKTNSGIDENWAKTIYPLKAENQRLREALKLERQLKDDALRAFNESQAALKGSE